MYRECVPASTSWREESTSTLNSSQTATSGANSSSLMIAMQSKLTTTLFLVSLHFASDVAVIGRQPVVYEYWSNHPYIYWLYRSNIKYIVCSSRLQNSLALGQ